MLANVIVLAIGLWGLYYTWTRRHKAGSKLFFDLASPVRNPRFYAFAIGLRLLVFGLCVAVSGYRILFSITD